MNSGTVSCWTVTGSHARPLSPHLSHPKKYRYIVLNPRLTCNGIGPPLQCVRCFRDPGEDIELAKDAIDAGFAGVWIGDHFHPWIDSRPFTHHAWTWLGTLMSEIPDVPVGTSVTCPMLRYRPPLLAQAIATLDNMFPGRIHLGVGTGEALNEAHFIDGEWPAWGARAGMLIETIDLMRKLWTAEEYVRHDGQYFTYDAIKLYTQPKTNVDIHWAAWGPQSCQAAGEYADHLITAASPEQIAEQLVPNLETGLERPVANSGPPK